MKLAANNYVELHLHTAFSFLDGASHAEDLIARALELGYDALAATDHDGLHGAMEFAQAAHAAGIRPITGAELTLLDGSHLTLLATSPQGYSNISKLITEAHRMEKVSLPRARGRTGVGAVAAARGASSNGWGLYLGSGARLCAPTTPNPVSTSEHGGLSHTGGRETLPYDFGFRDYMLRVLRFSESWLTLAAMRHAVGDGDDDEAEEDFDAENEADGDE